MWSSLRAKFALFVLGRPDGAVPQFVYSGSSGSKVLVVAFAGGANQIGAIPRLEFAATLAAMHVDHVLVSDWKQTWYLHTEASLRAQLEPVTHQYAHVVFVGNCLGATGALLMADLAHVVIAFGPLTSLRHARGWYAINSTWRVEESVRREFDARLSKAVAACKGCVHVYFSPEKDAYFASHTPANATVVVSNVGNPRRLRDKGLLVPFLRAHIDHVSDRHAKCTFQWQQQIQ